MMKNKREEELQLVKSIGLVTQKRSLFEEYYKRRRALKAMEEIKQAELTQQYGGYDPVTSQGELDETSVHIEILEDRISNIIAAHSGSALLESFPRTKEIDNSDIMEFDKKDISRKSDNSESDTTQERNSFSCEVRIHHRERWPTDHTFLIRAEQHRLSGLVGTSKKNCSLESNVGYDSATTGNVLHPANSNAAKSVCNILQEKANSGVLKSKENIPVKKEKGHVASVRDSVKVNQKCKTNTSQARSYQYQQILSMMKSKREEELQKLKFVGLVAQKRALFEEYYKRRRALKAMKEIMQSELTQQYGGDDPMTSQSGLDETSVRIETLGDEMSNGIAAHSGSVLLESCPRTKELEIHDNMDFDKKDISRKSYNSESDTKQEKNSLSCEVRIHHRERLPRDHTQLIRAERHELSGLVGSLKKDCKLKSKIGSDIATTGNVLHPANSHVVKSVSDNLLKKANSHVRKSKKNIPVKEEVTVASIRKRIISIPVNSYKPLRDGLFQGTSSKAASVKKLGTEIKRGSEQEQERVSATSHMGRVANVSELLKARTLRPFNLRAINQSNPHGGSENRSTIAVRKVELKETFSTAADNQIQVGVRVLLGEREMAADNKQLGEFELTGIPPAPRGMPQIEVTFDIDANGIVTVSAKDKNSGKEQQITIKYSGGLSEDEIEKMVRDAELHAQKDQERKALIDIRNSADTQIYSIEKSLAEYKEKIPAEVASEIEAAVSDLRAEMVGDSLESIQKKLDAANKTVSKIGEHLSGRSGGSSSSGGAQGGEPAPEAEYDEVKKQVLR